MFRKSKVIFVLLLSLGIAHAQTISTQTEKGWSGKVALGFANKTGNTNTMNFSGGLELDRQYNKWHAHIKGSGSVARDQHCQTADNFAVNARSQYYFLPHHFGFARADYKYDKFSPYLDVMTLVGGYGWKASDRDKLNLTLYVGPGLRRQQAEATREVEHDIILFGEGRFEWQVSQSAKFAERLLIEDGRNNDYLESKTSLTTDIINNLGLEASFFVTHNSTIAQYSKNTDKTDTITQLALVYEFNSTESAQE